MSEIRSILERKEVPPIEKVGGIFPRGYVSIVASKAGVGKTWFMLRSAMMMSNGEDIFGITYNPGRAKVGIFAGETGVSMLIRRLNVMPYDYVPENIIAYDALNAELAGETFDASDTTGRQNMLEYIRGDMPDIIYVDTLASFNGSDESDVVAMKGVMSFFQKVARMMNIAVVLNHHMRKAVTGSVQKKSQDEIIGSSILSRMAGSIFLMTADETGEQVEVINVKSWERRLPKAIMAIRNVNGRVNVDFNIDNKQRIYMLFEDFISKNAEGFLLKSVNELLCIGIENCRYLVSRYVDSGMLHVRKIHQSNIEMNEYYS